MSLLGINSSNIWANEYSSGKPRSVRIFLLGLSRYVHAGGRSRMLSCSRADSAVLAAFRAAENILIITHGTVAVHDGFQKKYATQGGLGRLI